MAKNKRGGRLDSIKKSLQVKDISALEKATRELLEYAKSGGHIHPTDIRKCYNNVKNTWPGLNMHKCFLSVCAVHLEILNGDKNSSLEKNETVHDFAIIDGRKLRAVENKINNVKSSNRVKSTLRKQNKKSTQETLDKLITTLLDESYHLYEANENFDANRLEKWSHAIKKIEARIISRLNIDK